MASDIDTLTRLMSARYSCRAYRPDPVPEEVVQQIIATAGRAPSWCNAQPWKVTVTRGTETRRFRDALEKGIASGPPAPDFDWPSSYSGAYQDRRRTCGFQLYDALDIARDDKAARNAQMMQNFSFFGAPHVALISTEAELGPYGAVDCGGFVTAFMLAATALGVASIAQASVAAYAPAIRAHFDLPETRRIVCAISFGYADEAHPANSFRTDRADLSDIYDPRG
ncbi:nitroreductase [Roseovarius faecimaris]|uniref:Nitroreductase n=1 Tax=Roseovarius faecimaris TaxID=2494550 RepID=A0A6I6IST9_9RHOB|nr:nitroreductase [Roseovarius faecimaris]QGX98861.1 nitroreductase [Roseovarius faecimaris]